MEGGERKADPSRVAAMAGSVHLLTDLSIHLNGDEATAHSRWTLIVRGDGRPNVSASGHYSDLLIRGKRDVEVQAARDCRGSFRGAVRP